MKRPGTFIVAIVSAFAVQAQEVLRDSTLGEVVVEAYSAGRPSGSVPSSIARLDSVQLSRFANTSLLPAVNMVAGVRMEERSPGSFRFSIRGSSLRSPFGVRNVKVYWNGIPFTDAGGNTYLNLLDLRSVGTIEVIKGPGGSLYGAGTGGVVLLHSPRPKANSISASALAGSYGLYRFSSEGSIRGDKIAGVANAAWQQAEGYRDQSAMRRASANVNLTFPVSSKGSLSTALLYSDLAYETPGGLTAVQYDEDPSQSRPATAFTPGAREQKAAIYNRTVFTGIVYEHEWNHAWTSTSALYGSLTDFANPFITNFEERNEPNAGLRIVARNQHATEQLVNTLTIGTEFQYMKGSVNNFVNNAGSRGDAMTKDKLISQSQSLFVQDDIVINERLNVTGALSLNVYGVTFTRTYPDAIKAKRRFEPIVSPRIAVLYKIFSHTSLYGSFSHGFSPPTREELFPSRGIFDRELKPESGFNVEAGLKGFAKKRRVYWEATVYQLALSETIVIRRDPTLPGEPDYFVNAGKTLQRGIELTCNAEVFSSRQLSLRVNGSYAFSHYRFNDYRQRDEDFSGNKLTGVPPTTAFAGIDLMVRDFYANISYSYTDHIPLNDANTVFAKPFSVAGAKFGYKFTASRFAPEFFAGVDNIFDVTYSLGNDLNAFGGRYFNAAPPRNYYAGLQFRFLTKP